MLQYQSGLPNEPILRVENLSVYFESEFSDVGVPVLKDINLVLKQRKTAIIGTCGSGKTLLTMTLGRILPAHAYAQGRAYLNGRDVFQKSVRRGSILPDQELVLIPQIPGRCYKGNWTLEKHLKEFFSQYANYHKPTDTRLIKEQLFTVLKKVGLPAPLSILKKYPHELSGVLLQRIILGLSLSLGSPQLLLLDEPSRGLSLLEKREYQKILEEDFCASTILLTTHDLDLVEWCDYLIVLCAGEIVEMGWRGDVRQAPLHPYTKSILGAYSEQNLMSLPGALLCLPALSDGCSFYAQCKKATERCQKVHPKLITLGNRKVRCFQYD